VVGKAKSRVAGSARQTDPRASVRGSATQIDRSQLPPGSRLDRSMCFKLQCVGHTACRQTHDLATDAE